jgi:uncharacterized membrane protein
MDEWFISALRITTRLIEIGGIAIIVIGLLAGTLAYMREIRLVGRGTQAYSDYRSRVGRAILLGLEFLVAADIINTVAIEPTLQSLGILAGIVLIRTFLSFSLEVEIEGRWPWQRALPPRKEIQP